MMRRPWLGRFCRECTMRAFSSSCRREPSNFDTRFAGELSGQKVLWVTSALKEGPSRVRCMYLPHGVFLHVQTASRFVQHFARSRRMLRLTAAWAGCLDPVVITSSIPFSGLNSGSQKDEPHADENRQEYVCFRKGRCGGMQRRCCRRWTLKDLLGKRRVRLAADASLVQVVLVA